MPRELSPGILYVSDEYAVAGHLCACGCGNKVIVSLRPAEWVFSETDGSPSLSPSIGNWQLPCRSHYWIFDGRVFWAERWSESQIAAGRMVEQRRRENYYASLKGDRGFQAWLRRIGRWLLGQ